VLLVAVPFAAGPLSLSPEWARGAVVLGGLGAVAAFGLWLSARRMVRATFHAERGSARRTAIAVAVGSALVAAGVALGIQPGGISGSWFAELLAPTAATTTAAVEAPAGATVLLVAALACLSISGIAVPRWFDRFRAERPAGAGGTFARRLYFAASNRAWLDDLADRATAAATRAGTAADRFDRVVLDPITGALLPSYTPAPETTWEARLGVAAATSDRDVAEVSERPGLDWLDQPDVPAAETVGPRVRTTGTPLERLSSATARLERRITSQGGGLYGALTNAISAFSDRTERVVFQRGIESVVGRATAALAAFSEAIERRVFELGPGRVARLGDHVRRFFLQIEELLGRPIVAALVALGCMVALSAAR